MTNNQLAVVNNIDHHIVFGSYEISHVTSPIDYADHAAVICSVIGDVDLFLEYPRLWEALFGLVEFEGREAYEFLGDLDRVQTQLNAESKLLSAHVTSLWISNMRDAALHELTTFGYIASTRIDRASLTKIDEPHEEVTFA